MYSFRLLVAIFVANFSVISDTLLLSKMAMECGFKSPFCCLILIMLQLGNSIIQIVRFCGIKLCMYVNIL